MLTPEKDTYITIKEANELLAFEPQAEKWATLSDECKEACLRSAARHIDGLPCVPPCRRLFFTPNGVPAQP